MHFEHVLLVRPEHTLDVLPEHALDVCMEHDPHCGCASRARFCMCVSSTLWNRVWSTFQILDVYLEHDLLVRPEHTLDVRLEHVPHSE